MAKRIEEQVLENTSAIQQLVDDAEKINELSPKGAPAVGTDNLVVQLVSGDTVSLSVQDIADFVNKFGAKIIINGNPFTLVKNPNNNVEANKNTLQVNDYVRDGLWQNDMYISLMIYLGGDINLLASWRILIRTKQIPLI